LYVTRRDTDAVTSGTTGTGVARSLGFRRYVCLLDPAPRQPQRL